MEATYRERVARGAALLDRTNGDWLGAIDLDSLDMAGSSCCVAGQVFDHYDDGIMALGLDRDTDGPHDHGFYQSPLRDDGSYKGLQDAWITLIMDRRRTMEAPESPCDYPHCETPCPRSCDRVRLDVVAPEKVARLG